MWAKIAKRGLQGLKNPYNEHRSIAMRLRQNMLTMLAQVVELVDTGGGIGRHATLRG